jgi:hypothetical protein
MVGAIQQIGFLADHATEIFDNLANFTTRVNNRIADISTRTSAVLDQLPEVQKKVAGINYSSSTAPAAFKQSEATHETQMFTPHTRPPSISARYNSSMNQIPVVKEMDYYLEADTLEKIGTCSSLYSNPSFFFNEWSRVESERLQQLQEEKEKKKRDRAARKAQLKKDREKKTAQGKPEKKKGLNWRDR